MRIHLLVYCSISGITGIDIDTDANTDANDDANDDASANDNDNDNATDNDNNNANAAAIYSHRLDIEFLWNLLLSKAFFGEDALTCRSFGLTRTSKKGSPGRAGSALPLSMNVATATTDTATLAEFQEFW
jgi:hypothetical protein